MFNTEQQTLEQKRILFFFQFNHSHIPEIIHHNYLNYRNYYSLGFKIQIQIFNKFFIFYMSDGSLITLTPGVECSDKTF